MPLIAKQLAEKHWAATLSGKSKRLTLANCCRKSYDPTKSTASLRLIPIVAIHDLP
jgi:hypothetical protein